jgi:predicted DNA-binding protein
MEMRLKSERELRLTELAARSGRATDELAEDAIAAYLEGIAELRDALDQRYDDFKHGKVQAIDGEAFFERLRLRGELLAGDPRNER